MIEKGEKFLVRRTEHGLEVERVTSRPTTSTIRWKTSPELFRTLMAELGQTRILKHFLHCLTRTYRLSQHEDIVLRLRLTARLRDEIDHRWDLRVCRLLYQSLSVEWLIWSLSTFGGALSAMGDYLSSFADKARVVSVEQLRIAEYVGDPILISRAKLYIALSLAQKNRIKAARKIVRQEYKEAKRFGSHFLVRCCEGVWAKLRSRQIGSTTAVKNGYNIYSERHNNIIR